MNQEQENFTPEEQLRNETEILKLEVENGAIIHIPEGYPVADVSPTTG